MSNAKMRRRLEAMPTPVIGAMIDNGDVHDDGGILEYSYHAYCNPGQAHMAGLNKCTITERPSVTPMRSRERL